MGQARRGDGEIRETGTAGAQPKRLRPAPGLPKDPQNRRLSPDEAVDEASLESMDASDPPAGPLRAGGPRRRSRQPKAK